MNRPSLIDVIENFSGDSITDLAKGRFNLLSVDQRQELTEHIEDFLDDAREFAYASDCVLLDTLSDPIVITNDPTEPQTTRRCKQVALLHTEIIIPLQPLILDPELFGNKYLDGLITWCGTHDELIRKGIFNFVERTNFLDIVGEQEAEELVKQLIEMTLRSDSPVLRESMKDIGFDGSKELDIDALDATIHSMLVDLFGSMELGLDLGFIEREGGELADLWSKQSANHLSELNFNTTYVMQEVNLPAVDQVSNEDFVQIRQSSEDFDEYRSVLRRITVETDYMAQQGRDIQEAFNANLLEARARIRELESKQKDKSIKKYMMDRSQALTISALGGASITQLFTNADPRLALIQAGISAGFAPLVWAMFGRAKNQSRLIRMYKALLNEPELA